MEDCTNDEMAGVPVLAREETLLRLGRDQELYDEILAAFVEELPDQFGLVKTHIASNQNGFLEHEFHSLKGASANVGAEALAMVAGKMELQAREQNWSVVKESLPALETEYKRVLEELKLLFPNLW